MQKLLTNLDIAMPHEKLADRDPMNIPCMVVNRRFVIWYNHRVTVRQLELFVCDV